MSIYFESDGRRYEWCGGYGSVFSSVERNVPTGSMRMIEGEQFYAFRGNDSWFWKNSVSWGRPDISNKDLIQLKLKFFGIASYMLKELYGPVE